MLEYYAIAGSLVLSLAIAVSAQQHPSAEQRLVTAQVGPAFKSDFVTVNGTSLHFVRGGTGPAVLLIHGFPEDWYEFRKIMPALAEKFTVVAVDIRGIGGSAPTESGYDAANLAEDIHQLLGRLNLEHTYIVGHDIGGMVAYALARRYPAQLRGAMILDVAFPGLEPWSEIEGRPPFWHIRFHQTNLPEKLLAGRQADYFRYFLGPPHFSEEDVAHYARSYQDTARLRSILEIYRAFPENARFNASHREMFDLPLIFGAGTGDAFAEFVPRIAEAMRGHGCSNVRTVMIEGSAHYIAEEQPVALLALISKYASE